MNAFYFTILHFIYYSKTKRNISFAPFKITFGVFCSLQKFIVEQKKVFFGKNIQNIIMNEFTDPVVYFLKEKVF